MVILSIPWSIKRFLSFNIWTKDQRSFWSQTDEKISFANLIVFKWSIQINVYSTNQNVGYNTRNTYIYISDFLNILEELLEFRILLAFYRYGQHYQLPLFKVQLFFSLIKIPTDWKLLNAELLFILRLRWTFNSAKSVLFWHKWTLSAPGFIINNPESALMRT